MMRPDKPFEEKFRFDRTISLSIILAIIVQTASALMWAGAAHARLIELEKRTDRNQPVSERLARLEEQVEGARASLTRIERRLDANPAPQ